MSLSPTSRYYTWPRLRIKASSIEKERKKTHRPKLSDKNEERLIPLSPIFSDTHIHPHIYIRSRPSYYRRGNNTPRLSSRLCILEVETNYELTAAGSIVLSLSLSTSCQTLNLARRSLSLLSPLFAYTYILLGPALRQRR